MERDDLKGHLLALLREDDEFAQIVARKLEQTVVFKELREFREEVNRRFEAMDKRFEAMQAEMNKRFEATDKRIETIHDWVGVVVGGFQTRAGRSLEDAVAGTLSLALRMKDVKPESIRMRQKIVDAAGMIGPAGREYEYDIFASNGETIVFEVKSNLDSEAVERFSDKADLAARAIGCARIRKVIVSLDKRSDAATACKRLGIELV